MDASNGQSERNQSNNNNKPAKSNQNVQVYVRVRPTNNREKLIRSLEVVEVVSNRELQLKSNYADSRTSKKFTFDRAFAPNSKQHEVYHAVVAPYIEEVLSGFNCTVFAYGQTGTGKTFTMVGEEEPELSAAWEDDTQTGIIPRAVNHLFDELRMTELEFSMRISYLELYNEELCDLLSTDDTVKIRIFDDVQKKGSVIVQGLEEIPVHSKDDVYKLLAKGQERRKTASTLMNAQSSRSHTIFSIIIHIKENGIDGEEMLKIGKLNLVDLAGSENISKAGNEKGIRTRETVNINQSLLTLGRVITALVEKTPHIPYRESKLTRLLQESLGGRTKTSIIATVSPGNKDFEETLSTLEYAHRAKNIQNKPEANQKLSKKTVIKEYTEEIDRLKRDLMAARDKNGIYLAEETYNEMVYKSESATKELNDKSALIKALKDDLAKKETIFKEVYSSLTEREEELRRTTEDLGHTRMELSNTKRNLSQTKRKYVEKKVILDHHRKTEQTLTGQAKELINVVEMVTEDTHGLHDTVDRRKEIDSKNKSASEQFIDRVRLQIYTIQDDVGKLATECNLLTADMNLGWKSCNEQEEKTHLETKGYLSTLETVCYSLLQQKTTLVEGFKVAMGGKLDEQYGDAIRYLEEVDKSRGALMQSFSAALEKAKNGIRGVIDCQLEETRKQFDRMITHGRAYDTKCIEFCNTFSERLSELEAIATAFERNHKRLEEYAAHSKEEYRKETEALKEYEQNVKTFLERMATSKQRQMKLSDIVSDVSNELNNQGKVASDQLFGLRESIEQKKVIAQESSSERDRHVDECALLSQQHNLKATEELDSVNLVAVEVCNQQLGSTIQEEHVRLCNAQKDIHYSIEEFTSNFEAQNVHFKQSQEKSVKLVVESLDAQQTTREQFCTANRDYIQRIRQTVESYERRAKDNQLVELQGEFERFHEKDLTFYQSTGKTPIRKKVQYPRDIAMTSPDDRIVRRFWREKGIHDIDLSMTICEDIEEINPIERCHNRDPEIRNSTPLFQRSNIMNMDQDRQHLKDLQISNIGPKIHSVQLLDDSVEENKENQELDRRDIHHKQEAGVKETSQNGHTAFIIMSP
ncbi:kinesin-like protein Klp61F [Anopheles nili]|uniref:kinesin-like protein Klp61F n=1 Tax=Anopheles nili TaxID=185578 RepID=UPI00237A9014|nr:kinesin-like protein Klp61F [Anopheles nili]